MATECSSCGATIRDEEAAFCPRCGVALGAPAGETTDRIDDPPPATGDVRDGGDTTALPALARDLGTSVRSHLVAGGWVRAAEAAAIAFLALLAAGAVFVLLAKLLDPEFGAGETPLWMLTRIVLAGLWSIGVAIERAGEGSAALPLGVLLVLGWVIASGARRTTQPSPATAARERAVEGAKVGVPFALFCFVAAIVFRVDDVGANRVAALFVPLVWGALFGALGGVSSSGRPRDLVGAAGERLEAARGDARLGAWAGFVMLGVTLALALAAVLLFLLVSIIAAGDVVPTLAEAVGFLVVLAAFLPNAVAGAASFALGAPLGFLARTIDGAEVERRASLILGADGARAYGYLLLLIPLVACLLGGYAARRRAPDPARPGVVLAAATATYALSLWLLVLLSGVYVSQAFIGSGNYLVVAGDPAATLLLAALWAAAVGYAGWRLADGARST